MRISFLSTPIPARKRIFVVAVGIFSLLSIAGFLGQPAMAGDAGGRNYQPQRHEDSEEHKGYFVTLCVSVPCGEAWLGSYHPGQTPTDEDRNRCHRHRDLWPPESVVVSCSQRNYQPQGHEDSEEHKGIFVSLCPLDKTY
jgi:hypothetical protein